MKKLILSLAILVAGLVPLMPLAAQDYGLKETVDAMGDQKKGFIVNEDLEVTIGQIVGLVLSFVGTIFLVLIIYAGFTWMLARGNKSEVDKAKQIMEAAVIGMVIIFAAYAVTSFIGGALTRLR